LTLKRGEEISKKSIPEFRMRTQKDHLLVISQWPSDSIGILLLINARKESGTRAESKRLATNTAIFRFGRAPMALEDFS
jgi:hypothetical protein